MFRYSYFARKDHNRAEPRREAWAEFCARTDPERVAIASTEDKDASGGFTACSFDDRQRGKEFIRECFGMSLDLETDHKTGRKVSQDMAAKVEKLGLAALLFSTNRHTPEEPRYRLVFPFAHPANAARTEKATRAILEELDEPYDKKSLCPEQIMYFPTVQTEAALEDYERAVFDGPRLDVSEWAARAKPERAPREWEGSGWEDGVDPFEDFRKACEEQGRLINEKSADDFMVQCTRHHDPNPSLHVVRDTDPAVRVKLHCFSPACEQFKGPDFFEGAGLPWWNSESAAESFAGSDYSEQGSAVGTDKGRRLVLTSAADIRPRPVRWVWDGRLPLGTLALLAGQEGLGKSTVAYWIAAQITRGELPGIYHGKPRGVLICATEDSWEHTIVPRLIAAEADLRRVHRIEVLNADDIHVGMQLPRDNSEVELAAIETEAALLLLDPLISRMGGLDTHRDAEVRQALEPMVAVADRTRMVVMGLIHFNKSGSADPLEKVMGSKAFTAVARTVHTVVPSPDDEDDRRIRVYATPKNNLGPTDLPLRTFTIQGVSIPTEEGDAETSRVAWGEEREGDVRELMKQTQEGGGSLGEVVVWLQDYLRTVGGFAPSAQVKSEGRKAGFSESALKRAKRTGKVGHQSADFPRKTFWHLPGVDLPDDLLERHLQAEESGDDDLI